MCGGCLPAFFLSPKSWLQHGEQGEHFQASQQHGNAGQKFAEARQVRIGTGSACDAEGWAAAAHSGYAHANGCQGRNAIADHEESPEHAEHDIDKKETGNTEKDIFWHILAIHFYMDQHLWMELLPKDGSDHLEQQYKARDLDAAGGGTCTAANEHEQQDKELGKGGPYIEIVGDEARGGGDGSYLEGRIAEGLIAGKIHLAHEIPGDEASCCTEHQDIGLEFCVMPKHMGAFFPDSKI